MGFFWGIFDWVVAALGSIGSGLIAWMKGIVCAVIYWSIFWTWAWVQAAFQFVPAGVRDYADSIFDGTVDLWQIADVFFPLHEFVPYLASYWTMLLAFRLFKIVNQLKQI